MRKSARAHHSTLAELNITPLLDLVFVLLVIFIITTPQLMNNLEMTLPSGTPPPPNPNQPPPRVHTLIVDAKGRTFLNGELLAASALRERLQQLKSTQPELRVIVKADDETDYQSMVNVLDLLQQLDITKVGLATDTPDAAVRGSP
jgi:biopolymer transport protein ExbD